MWANHNVPSELLRVSLCLALAGAALGAPSPRPAEAAGFVVDRLGDGLITACTGPDENDCTLRGAIQRATAAGSDTITFDGSYTITLGSTLVLTATGTTIQATAGQVVKINANNVVGSNVFLIGADDITLDGLRVYGAGAGKANIAIRNAAQRIKIANSDIGDDTFGFGGCGNSPNSHSGIYIDSAADPVTGDAVAWIYGNQIECNGGAPGHGIQIDGAGEVVIGADALGNATSAQHNFIQGNAGDGAYLSSGASLNTIRNSSLQYNGGNGLVIDGSKANFVYGNYFQHNDFHGIELRGGAQLNQIGCPLGMLDPNNTYRNVIRNNAANGILITGAGTNDNRILCNWIGVGDDGTDAAPNLGHGVSIEGGARFNLVGDSQGTGNVISGNALIGVVFGGAGTNDNLVRGNRIGTNAAGSGPVPNQISGVEIVNGASLNTIGGTFAQLNLIAGNVFYGVLIRGGTTATNTVTFNDIGYNSGSGLPIPNGLDGLILRSGTHHNVIGGAGLGNNLAYNLGNGLSLRAGAHNNFISVNSMFSNTLNGVLLEDDNTSNNAFTGTVILNNGQDGIAERASAGPNDWRHISTYANGGLGVDKNAASSNTNLIDAPFPTITSVNTEIGAIAGTASNSAIVEVYLAYPDVLRFGEGKTFVGSTMSNASGDWIITVTPGLPGCYTALETVGLSFFTSSEFGPNTCLQSFVPVVRR